jgi:hypothetical protein
MSDFQAIQAPAESQFEGPSQFDVSGVDSNLRAISAVEAKWRLPKLPDEVKLDLASMPEVDSASITSLLLGLDSDFNDVEVQEPELLVPDFMPDRTATDQFKIYSAGIAGEPHPTEVAVDAVQRFKWDAVQRGYLSSDTKLDSSWSPELESLRREMLYDEYNERLAGNRPGAVPTNKVIEQLGKWTSPTGLLAAATELDLWFDFGAINREWSSWGDKWRKVGESKNPLDFGKNLVDAISGPIDDVVFPALNLLMLGSGVGALANGGRLAMFGARAAQGGRLMRGLYGASGVMIPSTLSSIQEASWTAKRLMAAGGARGAIGSGLKAWRELLPVARIKQGVQVGMRAGFMSQAQDLFPGYQGGLDLSATGPVGDFRQGLDSFSHGLLATPVELALAPYNIFNQGTFMGANGLLRNAGLGFIAAGGSIPGRAVLGGVAGAAAGTIAGDDTQDVIEGVTYGALGAALLPHAAQLAGRTPAVVRGALGGALAGGGVAFVTDVDPIDGVAFGAATGASLVPLSSAWSSIPNPGKWVGYATDVIGKFSYRPIAEDQRVSMAFQKGIRRALADRPDQLQRWDETFRRKNSFLGALSDFLGTDEEAAAAAVSYVMVAAAIDHTARVQAAGQGGDAYHLFRNKLISQLRTFDLDGGQFLPEDIARAVAIDRSNGTDYAKTYERVLSKLDHASARDMADKHNAVARQTLGQLMSLENMPDLADGVRVSPWADATPEDRLGILEAYLPQALPTFGNWPLFTKQAHAVQSWVNDGLLDGAEFLPVETPYGTLRNVKADVFKVKDKILEADDEIVDTILRDPKARARTNGRVAPLARLQPSGRFTLARKDTVTKQRLEQMALELDDLVKASEKLQYLTQTGVMKGLRDVAPDGIKGMTREDLASFIRANGFGKNDSQLRYIHSFMNRHGVDDTSLAAMIDEQISAIAEDAETWAAVGLEPIIRNADSVPLQGVTALKARIKEIRSKARYTAAEIDQESIIRSIRETAGDEAAEDMVRQFRAMEADGYKLVHGVEYLMPHDLAVNTNLFKDIGVREMNAATLGNAFGRRHPAVARMQQERRERAMIVKALADHDLGDFDPEDERITQAYGDLRAILNEIQDPIAQRVEERQLLSFMDRKRLALESTFAPLRLEDLTLRRPLVIDRLKGFGWSDEQAEAIFSSLRHFRNTEFKDLGLYSFEAKMRERNELVQALKWMGGSKYGESLISSKRLGMAAGAFAGQDLAVSSLEEGASDDRTLGARIAGLVGGAAVGAGAAAGVGALVRHNDWIDDAIRRAEQRPAFMLADKFVRMRDGMRFALSPMFDISRYTEGLMLGQAGVPLRHPTTGKRISLPVNMSPSGVKKRHGVAAFNRAREEFRAAAKGQKLGDLDVLDDANHWFAQIGIMGFNPQDWQVAAFAELRQAGLSAEDAMHAAKETYTYGTRGRSPAELSVNFVFFPFSFQKKALGHVAKWMNDDLGRSIMIHDAYAAYQALDEKYNLDEFFKDHIPAMDMLRRFNLMAYGVSPGRFGGINSQMFETVGRSMILFSPIGVNIQDKTDYIELQKVVRSLVPAYNDLNWMIEEAKEGGNVAFSESHQTRQGQISDGYREWNEYRDELFRQLDEQGYSWSDLHRKPWLASAKQAYEAKRASLGEKYPQWLKSRQESIFNVQALEMEKNDLLALAVQDPVNAKPEALMLLSFEAQLEEVKRVLSLQGVSVDDAEGWLDAPPWATQYLREQAVKALETDPRFKGLWKKFYEKSLGPIEAKL